MDKLEPLIRHRFWVLFGIALPLALAGYFMTSGSMKAATEAKEQALQKQLDSVPKGDTEPNDTYAAGLKDINEQLKAANKVEVQKLWEGQKPQMDWPTILVEQGYLPDKFRGEIADSARRYYTTVYPEAIKGVWIKAQPMVDDPPPPGLEVTWTKKLLLMPETIPTHPFDLNSTPTNKQIWDAQEDVWLLGLLFDGIARANQDATSIVDAPVRRIDELYFSGGSGQSSVTSSPTAGMGGGEGSDDFGMSGMGMVDDGSGMGSAGLAGMAGLGARMAIGGGTGGVGFNVAEEFGMPVPDPEIAAAAQQAGGMMGGMPEDDSGMMGMLGDSAMMGMAMSGTTGMAGMQGAYRYIGDPTAVEAAPYRERGFYMSAIVMLPQLPNFFAEMSSSDWPIRILRFQIGPNPYAQTGTGGYSSGSFASGSTFGRNFVDDDINALSGGGGRRGGGGMRGGGGFRGGFGGGMQGMDITQLATMAQGSGIDVGSFSGSFGSMRAGGGASAIQLPMNMQGPYDVDPNWFVHPDLVQVDFCGIITMYNPQTSDELVPTSDGSSSAETEEAIREDQEARAAAEAAAASQSAETPSGDQPGTETAPPADGQPAEQPPADESGTPPTVPSNDQPAAPAGDAPNVTDPAAAGASSAGTGVN